MKVLLIDNGSSLLNQLTRLIPGEETVVHFSEIPNDIDEYSLIILSGSSQHPVLGNEDLFKSELDLIRKSKVPIIGICLGHELIASAFAGELSYLDSVEKGLVTMRAVRGHSMFKGRQAFTVYGNHKYGLLMAPPELDVLAITPSSIAIVKHIYRPIYGFQFHPEHMTDRQLGDEIFLDLVRELHQ